MALEAISGRSSYSSSNRIDYPFLQNGANRSICACILIRLASTGGARMELDTINHGTSTSRTPQSNKCVWSFQVTLMQREKSHLHLHKCAGCMCSRSACTVVLRFGILKFKMTKEEKKSDSFCKCLRTNVSSESRKTNYETILTPFVVRIKSLITSSFNKVNKKKVSLL